MTCFSLKMIKFLDRALLLLLVKTVMGHKNVVILSVFFSCWFQPSKCQLYAFQEDLCRIVLSEVRGVSLLEEYPWYLVFSWGNRFLGFIAQEEFMELKLLSRGKAERHKASLVSLFHCFAIAGGNRKQTPNFFQFCADLQVVERKFVSGVSREVLLVGCFLASLFH